MSIIMAFPKRLAWMIGLLFSSFASGIFAQTPGIQILFLNDYQQDQQLVVDASVKFEFSEAVLKAIHHEITLTFTTELTLNEVHRVFGLPLERNRASLRYQTQLQYDGFNRQYVITNQRNQNIRRFSNLTDAMKTLGTLSNFPVADLSDLHPNTLYSLQMRISLDRWQLPTPLIIDTLWSPAWQLDSGWYPTQIQSPKSWL
ncbi:MAG: DUF4390 domain-containing protein [Hydrogenovibrio sp.]